MDEDSTAFLDLIFDRDDSAGAAGALYDILAVFKDSGLAAGAADLNAGLDVLRQSSLDEVRTAGLLRATRAALKRCLHQLEGLNKATALFAIAFCDWHLDDTAKAEAGISEMLAVTSTVSSTLETLTNPNLWGSTVGWMKGGTAIAGVPGSILGGILGGLFSGYRRGYTAGQEAGALQVLQTYGRSYLEWRADAHRQDEKRIQDSPAETARKRLERKLQQSKQTHTRTSKKDRTTILQVQNGAVEQTPEELGKQIEARCPTCGSITHIAAQQGRVRVICSRCSRYFGVDA